MFESLTLHIFLKPPSRKVSRFFIDFTGFPGFTIRAKKCPRGRDYAIKGVRNANKMLMKCGRVKKHETPRPLDNGVPRAGREPTGCDTRRP